MDRSAILSHLEALVRRVLADRTISLRDDMLFDQIPGWDSFAQTQTIVAVEAQFDILFSLDELASVTTVAALVDTIERKLAATSAS